MKSVAVRLAALATAALSVGAAGRHPSEILDATPPGFNLQVAKATHPSHPSWGFNQHIQQTHNVQKIHGLQGKTNSKSVAAVLGAYQRLSGLGFGYQNVTPTNAYGTQYATDVLFNGHPLYLLVDTGSSDTWAVQTDYDCIDYASQSIPQAACQFGPAYPDSFQYGAIEPAQHMFIRYGDGEMVAGPMGYSDVTLGNITVRRQEICLANTTYWFGNNMTSGLIGLAFPALTNAYLGPGLDHSRGSRIEYSPLFTSMVSQGKVPPVFSIALDRNSTGILAWGGIAPAVGMNTSMIANMDMIIVDMIDRPEASYDYSFYTIIPDGWEYDQTINSKKYPFIVDSGTTLNYLPPSIAVAINQAFNPPAVYLWQYGAYFTQCDAIAPPIGVILDGITFWFNPVDLIYRGWTDPSTSLCMTSIANGGAGPYILGDAFMQGAVVVYDVGQAKMRFIPRPYY
ncbi:aspartic peptidase domain-containing protein [Podospora aff. communis PSN243]|uniref:Aspartic peptidase domain-containing protein n=1 Tax=Podospora aff. communis PSN243 TaxID=3040156 RepID=A0AAV9H215_9PEZI|nr:aspartic peptidase domain-containing protein [Podospora aff. communis PSN243]